MAYPLKMDIHSSKMGRAINCYEYLYLVKLMGIYSLILKWTLHLMAYVHTANYSNMCWVICSLDIKFDSFAFYPFPWFLVDFSVVSSFHLIGEGLGEAPTPSGLEQMLSDCEYLFSSMMLCYVLCSYHIPRAVQGRP